MQRASAAESNRRSATARGAEGPAPRATPLTLVSGAIAGDDLERVTATVAEALGAAVIVAIPALGEPVVRPAGALDATAADRVHLYATACAAGMSVPGPTGVEEPVAVRIGDEVVGVVAAGTGSLAGATELRAWLEAAAAAASINALIREAQGGTRAEDGAALVLELLTESPEDLPAFLARARRAGFDLTTGATALGVRAAATPGVRAGAPPGESILRQTCASLSASGELLCALATPLRLLVLVPAGGGEPPEAIADRLRSGGLEVAVSAQRRDPAALHEALREVGLLLALADAGVPLGGQDDTYRLLIGVLLRDPDELSHLRERTISPLADYDARHDTDLLATLQAFLTHDGSTTETAEAMELHRHTVGYRLSRVHEVSGLSPYESDGRERLSLGLKAHQILEADRRDRPAA